ncbi:AAA family ATPase [bacterium]|nr:AAA family ATPase [bacterium]
MYLEHFNLKLEPFAATPDPQFLFKSRMHQEALDRLVAAVTMRRGINAIIGEPGLGKSLLIRTTLQGFSDRVRFAWVFNTNLNGQELIKYICRDFGFTPQGRDLSELLMELYTFLIYAYKQGLYTVLVVDEAQSLKYDVLEEIRQLSNLETSRCKLLQVILSAQPQLDAYLQEPALHQLKQRISLKAVLNRLNQDDTRRYIHHRLRVAGGEDQDLFTQAALSKIYEISGGVPRLINQVCDNALLTAFHRQYRSIDAVLIQELAAANKVTCAEAAATDALAATAAPAEAAADLVTTRSPSLRRPKPLSLDFAQIGEFCGVDVESL